ncbi:MAG: efflux RND transporter periplasmic adaptor subunit [Planctomycetota bacterium]
MHVRAAEQGSLERIVQVTGVLAPQDEATLGFKVAGRLAELRVDLGSRVQRGDQIGYLEPDDFKLRVAQAEAALQQARARLGLSLEGDDTAVEVKETALVRQAEAVLDEARLTLERWSTLSRDEMTTAAQLDSARAALRVAQSRHQDALEEVRQRQAVLSQRQAELSIARRQLLDSTLTAPLTGVISERSASPGQFVAAGTPVATLVSIDPMRLRMSVPELRAASVRPGQLVRAMVEGEAGMHAGQVVRLSPRIDLRNRTLLVEAELDNPQGVLRPGAFVRAEIVTGEDAQVVLIPAAALSTFAGVDKVFVAAAGKAVEKRVEPGRHAGDRLEIRRGLAPGEPVILEPGNLVAGQAIQIQVE